MVSSFAEQLSTLALRCKRIRCSKYPINVLPEFGGRGGGEVVSMLAFYSDDPSSNPADAYSFSVKFVVEKDKNEQKRGLGHFKKVLPEFR